MPRRASPNSEILSKSVTANDYNKNPQDGYGGIYQLTIPYMTQGAGDLPPYWSPLRDRVLKTTPMRESMWASAVGIATSKVAGSDWRLDGRKIKYWQDLLLAADNDQSFVAFEEKQIRDYLLTDNGCHFEVVRTSDARGSRIIGIQHLPSWRVLRTGDPDIPVIYRDRRGEWHEMKDYQIVSMVDEADGDDIYFGTGHCAASRAWTAILKLSALELYVYEKISGKKPSRIYLVNANLNEKQLQTAIDAGERKSDEKGYVMYMDAIMVPILDPNATASVASIDLKGLPENFDPEKERIHAMLTYADSIGLDPVELDPNLAARGRAMGSGSQAQVLDDKQSGRGLVSYYKKKQYLLNEYVLPDRVTFFFGSTDLVDSGRQADILYKHIQSIREAVGATGQALPIFTPEQGKQLLVDMGDIPPEFLTEDLSQDETLRDNEKPSGLDSVHNPPVDQKLMLTEPPKPPAPTGSFGKPVARKSFNQHLTEKAYNARINQAEAWASTNLSNWFALSESELIDIYEANLAKPKQKSVKVVPVKSKETAQIPAYVQPQLPQIIMVQQQPQPITFQMPEIKMKEASVTVNQPPSNFIIQMPEQAAPVVTVAAPIVNVTNDVKTPSVTVTNEVPTPSVTLNPAAVTVNVPEQAAPTVKVINQLDQQPETMEVIRDSEGLIERVVKTFGGRPS